MLVYFTLLLKYSFKGFDGAKCTSDVPCRLTGLFDLLVLFQISTSGSLGHWIPRSPGSWASQACLEGWGGGGGGANPPPFSPFRSTILSTLTALTRVSRGAFHLTQNSGNFGWHIKWNGPFRFGPTGIFGTSFEGGPLWPVWSFRSVGPKCPFPFDKIVVPSTALLHPAYKNNNQTRGSLGRVCATGMYRSIGLWQVELPKFQTGIFVGWKGP